MTGSVDEEALGKSTYGIVLRSGPTNSLALPKLIPFRTPFSLASYEQLAISEVLPTPLPDE